MGEVLIHENGLVRELALNRPDAHNALNQEALQTLTREVERAERDGVRALIISGGAGRSFCAGADLRELAAMTAEQAWTYNQAGIATMRALEHSPIPVIAAVHGYALGGGLELALASSFVIAADDAAFGLPEAGLGLIPGYGGTQRLSEAIGRGPALRFMLTGERFDALEAARLGLLTEPAMDRAQLIPRAYELARKIAASGPLSVKLIMTAVGTTRQKREHLDLESALAAIAISSEDAAERIDRFLTRRTTSVRQ